MPFCKLRRICPCNSRSQVFQSPTKPKVCQKEDLLDGSFANSWFQRVDKSKSSSCTRRKLKPRCSASVGGSWSPRKALVIQKERWIKTLRKAIGRDLNSTRSRCPQILANALTKPKGPPAPCLAEEFRSSAESLKYFAASAKSFSPAVPR
jgi:hypothetical protein